MLSRLHMLAQRLRRRIRQPLVVASLCTLAVVAAAVVWFAVSSRQAAIDDAVREMGNDAMLLAEQEDRLLQSVDLIHLSVITHMRELNVDSADAFGRLAGTAAMQRYLSERVAGLGYIGELMLFDANGKLLNSSRSWPPPAVDGTDRDYVLAQMASWLPQPFLSGSAISKNTDKWTCWMGRHSFGMYGGRDNLGEAKPPLAAPDRAPPWPRMLTS